MRIAHDEAMAGALGLAVAVAIAALDLVSRGRSGVFTGLVAIGPFVTAVLAGPMVTAGVAVSAVVLALGLGVANGVFATFANGLEVTVVTVAGGLAVGLAWQRAQAQRSLTAMRDVAEAVQKAIIPPVPDTLGGMGWAARYESAAVEALLGGDFYEVVDTPFGVRAIIGDVCGKGLPAARLAARAVGSFATVAQLEPDLLGLVRAMEASLASSLGEEEFITAAVVEFCGEAGVRVVNCGHHPPLLLVHGGAHLLTCPNESLPLGFRDDPALGRFSLPPGSRLLLYTDGLVEARNGQGAMLAFPEACIDALASATLQGAADELLSCVRAHTGGSLHDDIALLLAERTADG